MYQQNDTYLWAISQVSDFRQLLLDPTHVFVDDSSPDNPIEFDIFVDAHESPASIEGYDRYINHVRQHASQHQHPTQPDPEDIEPSPPPVYTEPPPAPKPFDVLELDSEAPNVLSDFPSMGSDPDMQGPSKPASTPSFSPCSVMTDVPDIDETDPVSVFAGWCKTKRDLTD